MKPFLSFLLMAVIASACAQTVKNNQVVLGKTDSVNSKILKEKRKVWVYTPNGSDDPIFSTKRYPVVYLLDGDAHFPSVAGMIQQLSEVNGNTICPQMIVVGIPNTDRTRDLTPSKGLVGSDGKKANDFPSSGGGENFTAFIEKELIPHIDSVYPTAPYKILIGHSFGGLTVMNILINHTNMFNAYVAIDPSMWWDNRKLLNEGRDMMSQQKFEGKSLFLAIANTMPPHMDTLQVQRDTTGNTGHIRSILELAKVLKSNPSNGLKFSYRYYNDDNHGSVPLIAEYDALHFLFDFYKTPNDMVPQLYDPKSKLDVVEFMNTRYKEISKHMGYPVLPPENDVNQMGYYFMQSKAPAKAFALFSLNIQNYPGSFNVYDSMGDYYNDQKNKAKAMEYFNKALKIFANPDTKEKLAKLQAAK
jgi:predicted alpha/beta superfamily hydrolase